MGISIPSWRCEEIKRIVVDLFVKYEVHCIPISGFELASKMGITVVPYSAYPISVRQLMMKESEDGFCARTGTADYIFYNDTRNYGRINYTILHEIGHIVLDHSEDSELAEKEVNFFAKFALVPPVLVHRLKLSNPTDIANMFDVSRECAKYALVYYRKWLQFGSSDYTDYEIILLKLFDGAA